MLAKRGFTLARELHSPLLLQIQYFQPMPVDSEGIVVQSKATREVWIIQDYGSEFR